MLNYSLILKIKEQSDYNFMNRALKLHPLHHVYLIKDTKGKTYIGYTSDLDRRLKEHEHNRGEITLAYCESYLDKEDAMERERKLKQRGQGVCWVKERAKRSLSAR